MAVKRNNKLCNLEVRVLWEQMKSGVLPNEGGSTVRCSECVFNGRTCFEPMEDHGEMVLVGCTEGWHVE